MKLINSVGPNPRVVRVFMAERGLSLDKQDIDIRGGENRREPHLSRNPSGQSPTLELDDGTYLAEITAICEYLDEKNGHSPLIGTTPEQRAETRMWVRRIDLGICEPLTTGFRFSEGLKMFQERMRCLPEAASGLKQIAQDKIKWLDGQMQGKQFVCGDRFTLADILLFCFLDFAQMSASRLDPNLKNINAWFERVKARPSIAA